MSADKIRAAIKSNFLFLRETPGGDTECDPRNAPCGEEWVVVTRYACEEFWDLHAWVEWAPTKAEAQAKARAARGVCSGLNSIVYQAVVRTKDLQE